MRKICNGCCVLVLPVLIAAYILGWKGFDFCGGTDYGLGAAFVSALGFILALAASEYLLCCFSGLRDGMTLGMWFWGAQLALLAVSFVNEGLSVLALLALMGWAPLWAKLPS